MNQIVTLMTIATLSIASLANAAEKDESSIPNAIERLYAIGSISHDAHVKRPAILPALHVTLAVMQAWDVYSTTAALKAGASEGNPIAAPFTGNSGSMTAFKAMSTASTIYFAERLWKTNRVNAEPQASESVILAELLALRTILLNLHFTVCSGAAVTAETMQRLIERADQEKQQQAEARLAAADRRRP